MKVALKVDVDTYDGMRDGVPRLLQILDEFGIGASFFITYGPDHSGRAVWRAFTRRGFVGKMVRSNAVRMYGLRTALRGTLLPAPLIGGSFPDLVREIARRGHEVGVHAWDHVRWHDHLPHLSAPEIQEEFAKACTAHEAAVGQRPQSSAAAGWMCTPTSLRLQDEWRLLYQSDTRGVSPFFPVDEGGQHTLQIPTTLPTLDEALGGGMCREENADEFLLSKFRRDSLNVFTLHAEAEGRAYAQVLRRLVARLTQRRASFVRLEDHARELLNRPDAIPAGRIRMKNLRGRAGEVACQEGMVDG